jgi:hypothetical protein
MKDTLGDRMKEYYENRTKTYLPRRTYTLIRIDGKAFHTYTKGLNRPFDDQLMDDMDETAIYLCKNIQGAKLAFVQSDEISILLTDFDKLQTSAWFDGNIQKITSVSSSLATAKFNELRPNKLALFDSRVFTIPSKVEVENYFIWRQQDTVRNSISSVAQSLYSSKDGGLRSTWESTPPPTFTSNRGELIKLIPSLDTGISEKVLEKDCPACLGTGKDGHDRCDPPNWYICEKCKGTGKIKT